MTELTSQPTASRELALDAARRGRDPRHVQQRRAARRRPRRRPRAAASAARTSTDDFEIERLAGKVRLRDDRDRLQDRAAPDRHRSRAGPRDRGPAGGRDRRSAALSGDVEAKGIGRGEPVGDGVGRPPLQVDGGPVAVESMSGDVEVVATAPIELARPLGVRRPRASAGPGSTPWPPRRRAATSASTAALGAGQDHVISSVSGDVELTTSSAVRVDTQSITGDVRASGTRFAEGGRGRRTLVVGAGTVGVSVRTTSGDIRLRGVGRDRGVGVPRHPCRPSPAAPPSPDVPPAPPAASAPVAPVAAESSVVAEAEAAPNLVRSGRPAATPTTPAGCSAPGRARRPPRGRPARDPPRARARRPRHRVRVAPARDPRGRRPAVLPGVVLMAADPLDEVLRLVSEGRLTAEEAAPILAALDDACRLDPADAPAATPPPSAGPGSEPPGGFGSNPPPGFAPGGASRAERGRRPEHPAHRGHATPAGRSSTCACRSPSGKLALDRIPGLPAEQVVPRPRGAALRLPRVGARGRRRRRRRADRPRMTALRRRAASGRCRSCARSTRATSGCCGPARRSRSSATSSTSSPCRGS